MIVTCEAEQDPAAYLTLVALIYWEISL